MALAAMAAGKEGLERKECITNEQKITKEIPTSTKRNSKRRCMTDFQCLFTQPPFLKA